MSANLREVDRKARMIVRMLQATMGLEGQALDRTELRKMKMEVAKDLLLRSNAEAEAKEQDA